MAKSNFVASKDILLYINTGDSDDKEWKKVACSTSDGFSGTTDTVDVATKCNSGFTNQLPGDKSWTFENTCYVSKENEDDSDFISLDELFESWAEDNVTEWKMESLDEEFDYYREGRGFISDYSETADQGDYLQFELTINGSGEIVNEESA